MFKHPISCILLTCYADIFIIFLQEHPLDVQYFDKAFTAERAKLTPVDREILQSMDQTQFQGFSYTNPNATD
jgi:Protein kinase C terminal domain.